jgi:predicted metallopeptidase
VPQFSEAASSGAQRQDLISSSCYPGIPYESQLLCIDGSGSQAESQTSAASICKTVRKAVVRLAEVDLPLNGPVDIHVVPYDVELHHGRVARFDGIRKLVTILEPGKLSVEISSNSAFSRLNTDAYFKSLIVHELAHVALFEIFGHGVDPIAHEYVAYPLQLDTLRPADREVFLDGMELESDLAIEHLNEWILMFSPDVFAAYANQHFQSNGPGAEAVKAAMTGQVVFRSAGSPE